MKSTSLIFAFIALAMITANAHSLDELVSLTETLFEVKHIESYDLLACFDEKRAAGLFDWLEHIANGQIHLKEGHGREFDNHVIESWAMTKDLSNAFQCVFNTKEFKSLLASTKTGVEKVSYSDISKALTSWEGSASGTLSTLIDNVLDNVDKGDFLKAANDFNTLVGVLSQAVVSAAAPWNDFVSFVNGMLSSLEIPLSTEFIECTQQAGKNDGNDWIGYFKGLGALWEKRNLERAVKDYVDDAGKASTKAMDKKFLKCLSKSDEFKTLEKVLGVSVDFDDSKFKDRIEERVTSDYVNFLKAMDAAFDKNQYVIAGQMASQIVYKDAKRKK